MLRMVMVDIEWPPSRPELRYHYLQIATFSASRLLRQNVPIRLYRFAFQLEICVY